VTEGRKWPEDSRVRDEYVEMLPTLIDRGSELIDAVALFEVELKKRSRAAGGTDFVVERLKSAKRPRCNHDVSAGLGKAQRHRPPDAA
jgi:hypothetical protein